MNHLVVSLICHKMLLNIRVLTCHQPITLLKSTDLCHTSVLTSAGCVLWSCLICHKTLLNYCGFKHVTNQSLSHVIYWPTHTSIWTSAGSDPWSHRKFDFGHTGNLILVTLEIWFWSCWKFGFGHAGNLVLVMLEIWFGSRWKFDFGWTKHQGGDYKHWTWDPRTGDPRTQIFEGCVAL